VTLLAGIDEQEAPQKEERNRQGRWFSIFPYNISYLLFAGGYAAHKQQIKQYPD
jgi:hypothetical protein